MTLMWLDLQKEILEEFAAVSTTERGRMAYERWASYKRARRQARIDAVTEEIEHLRAIQRRIREKTRWHALLAPEAVAAFRALPRKGGGKRPVRARLCRYPHAWWRGCAGIPAAPIAASPRDAVCVSGRTGLGTMSSCLSTGPARRRC